MRKLEFRVCQTCVMDSSDPNIEFFPDGTCNHCRHASNYASQSGVKRYDIEDIISHIKNLSSSNYHSKYDCIVGLSGGVDSTWLLHLLANKGLRIYVHHVDTGWNTPKAVSNIYRICDRLKLNLNTHVVDWKLLKKIHQAYFYLGVLLRI